MNLIGNGTPSGDTTEIIGNVFEYETGQCLINASNRKISYNFMAAEAAYILSGRNNINYLTDVLPLFEGYSDDGYYQAGAYGPKVVDQLPYVLRTLEKNIESRQAVINIWRERPYDSKDIPCTLSMQFLVRAGKLQTIVNMRSSDAYKGLIYDTFCFGMISLAVAGMMEVDTGMTKIMMGSSHLYDSDYENAEKLIFDPGTIRRDYKNFEPALPQDIIEWLERVSMDKKALRRLIDEQTYA